MNKRSQKDIKGIAWLGLIRGFNMFQCSRHVRTQYDMHYYHWNAEFWSWQKLTARGHRVPRAPRATGEPHGAQLRSLTSSLEFAKLSWSLQFFCCLKQHNMSAAPFQFKTPTPQRVRCPLRLWGNDNFVVFPARRSQVQDILPGSKCKRKLQRNVRHTLKPPTCIVLDSLRLHRHFIGFPERLGKSDWKIWQTAFPIQCHDKDAHWESTFFYESVWFALSACGSLRLRLAQ